MPRVKVHGDTIVTLRETELNNKLNKQANELELQAQLIENLERQLSLIEGARLEQCSKKIEQLLNMNAMYQDSLKRCEETNVKLKNRAEFFAEEYAQLCRAIRIIKATTNGIKLNGEDEGSDEIDLDNCSILSYVNEAQ